MCREDEDEEDEDDDEMAMFIRRFKKFYKRDQGFRNRFRKGTSSNRKDLKDKEQITQQHIQEAYQTNMSLHRRIMKLEATLQKAETLLREKAQQIRELEEVLKIPVLRDEQLETEHKLVMEASSNIVSLALEDRIVD